jgi:hypothetical protein
MTAVMNAQGRIYQNPITPESIWPLNIDRRYEKKMITTMAQAMQLLKEYK